MDDSKESYHILINLVEFLKVRIALEGYVVK